MTEMLGEAEEVDSITNPEKEKDHLVSALPEMKSAKGPNQLNRPRTMKVFLFSQGFLSVEYRQNDLHRQFVKASDRPRAGGGL
jgi:hypothetical protein